jgi:hypothetical protein
MRYNDIAMFLRGKSDSVKNHRWGKLERRFTPLCKANTSAHYFFEFWVYLLVAESVAATLGGMWNVCSPDAKYRAVWPMSPAHPDGFSYIDGAFSGMGVTIRPGVNANAVAHAMTIAPDVSVRLSSKLPTIDHEIVRCWDAKWRNNIDDDLSRNEIFAFMLVNEWLIPKPPISVMWKTSFDARVATCASKPWIAKSALITNGATTNLPASTLMEKNIQEISYFNTGSQVITG